MGPVILSSSELARMREQVRAPPGRSPRAPSPSASAHPFPLSSFPPDRTTPRPRAASRRDHHPGNARRRPRAPQGSERCPRGPVAEHARGTRSPRRPRRDGPADPILDETRRDVEARAREKKKESRRLDERDGRTALTFPPPNRPDRPRRTGWPQEQRSRSRGGVRRGGVGAARRRSRRGFGARRGASAPNRARQQDAVRRD